MTLSDSRLAYQDCLDAMDRALEDQKGARIPMPDYDAAQRFRARLHQARVLDRRANKRIYAEDHAMYGCSIYDEIVVRIKKTKTAVYIYLEKQSLVKEDIEALSEIEEDKEEVVQAVTQSKPEDITPISQLIEGFRRRA